MDVEPQAPLTPLTSSYEVPPLRNSSNGDGLLRLLMDPITGSPSFGGGRSRGRLLRTLSIGDRERRGADSSGGTFFLRTGRS